jgi:acyl-CoA synthetase (NDP forming)
MSEGEKLDPGVFSAIAASTTKPLVAISRLAQNVTEFGRAFQVEAGIPFVQGLPNGVRALAGLVRYGEACRRGISPLSEARERSSLRADNLGTTLADYAIMEPRSAFASTADDAVMAARNIGFPAVLKIVSPQASHKTEVGGVALNLKSEADVREAASAMTKRLHDALPSAEIAGFLLQEEVKGLELLVGVRDDPEYGPIMVFGLGGIFVEAIRDVVFRLLPVTEADVGEMITELRGRALFGLYRNRPEPDILALKRAVAGLSRYFADHRRVLSDLEINPLVVLKKGDGVRAVDIRPVWK